MGSYTLLNTQLLKYTPYFTSNQSEPIISLVSVFDLKLQMLSIAFTIKSGGLIIASEPTNLFNLIPGVFVPVLCSLFSSGCQAPALPYPAPLS